MFGIPFHDPPPPKPEKPELPTSVEETGPELSMTLEERKLLNWRIDCLMKGGFPAPEALALARDQVDYRYANMLLKASGDLDWTLDQLL